MQYMVAEAQYGGRITDDLATGLLFGGAFAWVELEGRKNVGFSTQPAILSAKVPFALAYLGRTKAKTRRSVR